MEVVRLDEEPDLKSGGGLQSPFAGASPAASSLYGGKYDLG